MTEYINLEGKEFGNLTVLERAENDKHGKCRWLCKCSCGNYKIICSNQLMRGDTKSCGCLRYLLQLSQIAFHHRSIDIIGLKINKLKVLDVDYLSYDKKKRKKYLCECECGKKILVLKKHLLSFKQKSCGCFRKIKNKATIA
ncbi:MAG: hypothetical protein AABY22_13355 [Nanoarchaeota archaeon]